MADVLPGYTWNKGLARYRNTDSGRFVSRQSIRGILLEQTQGAESRLRALAVALYEKRISSASYTEQMKTESRRNMLQNAALAKGGFDRLTQADYGRIGAALRGQYAQMAGTAQDIAAGTVSLPQVLNRVAGYAGAGRSQFFIAQQTAAPAGQGELVTIARRVLGDAAHCQDCLAYYEQGWQPIIDVVPPGVACQCSTHCRCDLLIREVPSGELTEWIGTKR